MSRKYKFADNDKIYGGKGLLEIIKLDTLIV